MSVASLPHHQHPGLQIPSAALGFLYVSMVINRMAPKALGAENARLAEDVRRTSLIATAALVAVAPHSNIAADAQSDRPRTSTSRRPHWP